MITPLGQRQIFTAANMEAVRAAQDVSEQLQREAMQRKSADARLAEAQESVNRVAEGQAMRAEERRERRRDRHPGTLADEGAEGDGAEDGPAAPAEPHLDLLA